MWSITRRSGRTFPFSSQRGIFAMCAILTSFLSGAVQAFLSVDTGPKSGGVPIAENENHQCEQFGTLLVPPALKSFEKGVGVMLHLDKLDRSYGPETITVMTRHSIWSADLSQRG
jgi:hypothetical protein